MTSPRHRTDSRHDFPDAERFNDEIVGSQFEAHNFIDLFRLGTDENDGDVRVCRSDRSADVVAAAFGHHDVQANKVWNFIGEMLKGCSAIRGLDDLVAFSSEYFRQAMSCQLVVFGK